MFIGPQSPHHKIVIITTARCARRRQKALLWLVLAGASCCLLPFSVMSQYCSRCWHLLIVSLLQPRSLPPCHGWIFFFFLRMFCHHLFRIIVNTHFHAILAKNVNTFYCNFGNKMQQIVAKLKNKGTRQKKNVENSTLGLTPPYDRKCGKFSKKKKIKKV